MPPEFQMIAVYVLAFFGFVGTVSGIILHLNVRSVVQRMQTEVAKLETKIEAAKAEAKTYHGDVQIGIEQLKTKMVERELERSRALATELRENYADKNESNQKHLDNSRRLDLVWEGQAQIRTEVQELRKFLEMRLVSIEERLPV